uniref:Uncharacterized protein n=1 Tax=Romanomermis culicivorax TaxID=13658 RepID=A0A915J407_ROMCU
IHKYNASYEKQVKCGFPTSKASLSYTHCLRRNRRINEKIVKNSLKKYDDDIEGRDYTFNLAMA